MAKTSNEKYREVKKNIILEGARLVFCRKGYLGVTMQDIIDECGISRGGIYLYFSSVGEVFREVAAHRSKVKFSVIRKSIEDNKPFESVLRDYLYIQKERLLNMDNSLLRAMYEYNFSRSEGATQTFKESQLDNIRKSVMSILLLGVRQNVLKNEELEMLTDHIVIIIEGLSVLALTDMLAEKIIDEQFTLLNNLINNNYRR